MRERKQYYSLDLAKFVGAILIIMLHTSPFSSYSRVLNYGFRNIVTVVAVPFFFITSGFLFFAKFNALNEDEQREYFFKYIKRLSLMYLIWSIIYFPFVMMGWIQNGVSLSDVIQYIKRFIFEGSYSTIWFLPALITAITAVWILRKRLSFEKIIIVSLPFYIFACLGSSYLGFSERVPLLNVFFELYFSFFDKIKNGILFGFFFVAVGGYFATKRINIAPKTSLMWSVVFFLLMGFETVVQSFLGWSKGGVDTKLFLAPLSVFLFLWVLSFDSFSSKPVFSTLRKLSLLMFLSQRIFLTLFEWYLSDTVIVTNSVLYFFSVFVLTVLFSYMIIKVSDRIKILRYLY